MHVLVVAKDCGACQKLLKTIKYDGSGKWRNMIVDELESSVDLFFTKSDKYSNVQVVPSLINGQGALVADGYDSILNVLRG